MNTRVSYGLVGALVGAAVDVFLNLIADVLQGQPLFTQLGGDSLWWLLALTLVGLLIGQWLGVPVEVPKNIINGQKGRRQLVRITRMKAFWSYIKIRGKGIELREILSVGSEFDINSEERKK